MKIDEIKYSLKNVMHRKLRSYLTLLSILIGIMSIAALVSFGLGIKNYMDTLSEEMGSDKLFIMPKSTGAPGTDDTFFISDKDIDFVSKINGVEEIMGYYSKPAKVQSKNDIRYTFLLGYDPDKTEFMDESFGATIEFGRHLKKGDTDKVVLGHNYMIDDKFLKNGLNIGDKIEVNGYKFEIVGFYEEIGNPQDDAQVYITYDSFEKLYPDSQKKFGFVVFQAEDETDPEELADFVEDKLRKFKGQKEGKEDFYVQTFSDFVEIFATIINVINGVLFLIALISVVVASVNIMNTMYTAVLERTKEIGIMKAVGAKNKDIFFIFMFESGFLGLLGGGAGMLLGYLISYTGGQIAAGYGYALLQPYFPWYLTAGCLLFSFGVGVSAGFLPALQASKQKPVDSLRYE
jgi:putative ABC transport system permease protein